MHKENNSGILRPANNIEPFLLKPHHLRMFRRLVVGIKASNKNHEYAGIADRAKRDAEQIKTGSTADYKKDVIGETPEDLATYTQNLISAAVDFQLSAEERMVQIAADKKDVICQACIIGDHCNQLPLALRAKSEDYYIKDFLSFARAVPKVLSKIKVEKRPIEGTQYKQTVLITNVGTLKTVFRDSCMDHRM